MTEAEWLACGDPEKMLDLVGPRTSARKHRLIACAAWRAGLDPTQAYMVVASTAEQWADGLAGLEDVLRLEGTGFRVNDRWILAQPEAAISARRAVQTSRELYDARRAVLIRDIIGPVCPLRFPRPCPACLGGPCTVCNGTGTTFTADLPEAWLTPDVVQLATAAYAERCGDPARLRVLSDALEEAGCGRSEMLDHLRGPGPHVPGCWVLDLVLGKS